MNYFCVLSKVIATGERERKRDEVWRVDASTSSDPKLVECWYWKGQMMGGWRELPIVYETSRANPMLSLSVVVIISAANHCPKPSRHSWSWIVNRGLHAIGAALGENWWEWGYVGQSRDMSEIASHKIKKLNMRLEKMHRSVVGLCEGSRLRNAEMRKHETKIEWGRN